MFLCCVIFIDCVQYFVEIQFVIIFLFWIESLIYRMESFIYIGLYTKTMICTV